MNIKLVPELTAYNPKQVRAFYVTFKPITRTVFYRYPTINATFVRFPKHRFEIYVARIEKRRYQLGSLYFQVYGKYYNHFGFHNVEMPNIDYGYVCLGQAVIRNSWQEVIENSIELFWATRFEDNGAFPNGKLDAYGYSRTESRKSKQIKNEKEFENSWDLP